MVSMSATIFDDLLRQYRLATGLSEVISNTPLRGRHHDGWERIGDDIEHREPVLQSSRADGTLGVFAGIAQTSS